MTIKILKPYLAIFVDSLFIDAPIVCVYVCVCVCVGGVCVWSMFCYLVLCVLSSLAIILMGKRELVALYILTDVLLL